MRVITFSSIYLASYSIKEKVLLISATASLIPDTFCLMALEQQLKAPEDMFLLSLSTIRNKHL